MTFSAKNIVCTLFLLVISGCVSVERIPDHFCNGWEDGLAAANQTRASVGLNPVTIDCYPDGGPLSEIEVITQKTELGRLSASELYCWGGTNGYSATLLDTQEAQAIAGLTDQELQNALVEFYRECVAYADGQ